MKRIVNLYNLVKSFFVKEKGLFTEVAVETLLKAKSNLEQSIKTDWEFANKFISKKKPKIDEFLKAVSVITKKEEQLVMFKVAQQKVNLKTHLDGKSNFAYIYELSNLNNRREYIETAKKKIASLGLAKDEFNEPNRMLDTVVRQIQVISEKLTNFNRTEKARVQLVPGLNLL